MEFTVNYSLLTSSVSWEGVRSSSEGRGKSWGKVELADPRDSASMPSFLTFTSHLYSLILSRYFYSFHYRGVLPQPFRSAMVWREGVWREDERNHLVKLPGFVSLSPSKVGQGSFPHLTLSPPAPPGLRASLENPAMLSEHLDYSYNYKLTCTLKNAWYSFYSPLNLCPQDFRLPRSSPKHVWRVTLEGAEGGFYRS